MYQKVYTHTRTHKIVTITKIAWKIYQANISVKFLIQIERKQTQTHNFGKERKLYSLLVII